MARMLLCTLLLLGTPMFCQQQPQNPDPTVPNAQVSPENTGQVDQLEQPLQNKAAGNERIQSNLQSVFDDDPTLSGANVAANVDDESIILTGTVESYLQHQRVLQLVSPYFSYRTVVDKVTVQ
jgi:osmotically-inducible protein OsmY